MVLTSPPSSATLPLAQPAVVYSISDDRSIARGLLFNTKIPRRRTSLGVISTGSDFFDGSKPNAGISESNDEGQSRRVMGSSNTWTSSSGDVLSNHDDIEDRSLFVQEYNRIAKKHGVRIMIPDEYETVNIDYSVNSSPRSGGWFSRKILRRTSSTQSIKSKTERPVRHRRSISDLSMRINSKKNSLKDKDLQELVRLCGSSLLYLPAEYAAGSLAVPTCFRATAQFLVQHAATTRGVFRISGSHSVVAALYNHYCAMDEGGEVVAGTVRCPTLPEHIRCDVHDVASAFKKFLSGLPGGILGSLLPFDAFVSIQCQLQSDPELTRTKHSKVRARLIALAIATLRSQYRRELICAVFGLLCMIGRAAETARREDSRGRPLPTSDLMGYGPLGIVFGPLLVGDLLANYTMRLANPHGGLVLLPVSPPRSRKEKHKKTKSVDDCALFNTQVDKIRIANGITEMLITHWRDVVRHMKNLGALKAVGGCKGRAVGGSQPGVLRPSASESFSLRKPTDWANGKALIRSVERSVSPSPAQRGSGPPEAHRNENFVQGQNETLKVKKQRSRLRPMSSQMLSGTRSMSILSPTVEEHSIEDHNKLHPKATPFLPTTIKSAEGAASHIFGHGNPGLEDQNHGTYHDRLSNVGSSLQRTQPHRRQHLPPCVPQLQPDITASRASSPIPDGIVATRVRRIAASDPGGNPAIRNWSPIQPPKPTWTDCSRRNVIETGSSHMNNTKDPLAKVSYEEDIASLEVLGKALELLNKCSEIERRSDATQRHGFGVEIHDIANADSETGIRAPSLNEKRSPSSLPSTSYLPGPKHLEVQRKGLQSHLSQTSLASNDTIIASPPKVHKHQSGGITVAPISPGKVKAIAARLNTAESASPSILSSVKSPTKTPTKPLLVNDRTSLKSPKESLIAPYTTNSPSPARSQMSPKSDRSLQSNQNLIPADLRLPGQGISTPVKNATIHQFLRSSLKESTPFRSLRTPFEETTGSLMNLKPGSGDFHRGSPRHVRIAPAFKVPTDIKTFDGTSGSLNLGNILPPPDSHPLVDQVNFIGSESFSPVTATENSLHPRWAISDVFSASKPFGSTTCSRPSRSNSMLHAQIRILQKQLSGRAEEVQQLKQQLDARGALDLGTLSEQLRDTKRELQNYKSRAEQAEKKLEMLKRNVPNRNEPGQNPKSGSSVIHSDQLSRSRTAYSEDGIKMVERIRRTWHGIDGGPGWQDLKSQDSSDTLFRDIPEATSDGEYSLWVTKTMMAIDSAGPHELG